MQSLDPRVIALFFIKNFLGTVYVLPLWFIGVFIFEKIWTSQMVLSEDVLILILDGAGLIFFALLILISYIWSWLIYTHFTYDLQPDGFHVRSGIVIRRHIIVPYTDIENVDLLVNPLVVRILDLYSLRIKTRQLENTEGLFKKKQTQLIPGLTSEIARALRAELLQYSHVQKVKKTYFDPISGNYR
jgi:membrane protein YdbS with pleckstrin-like domain